ncbi:hypothetical protein ACVWU4_000926 [Campylobacter coli]
MQQHSDRTIKDYKHITGYDYQNTLGYSDFNFIPEKSRELKERLSSPDAEVLLRELYDIKFIKGDSKFESLYNSSRVTEEEHAFRPVMYREEENAVVCTELENIVTEYAALNIKKYFGYTLEDYLNITPMLRNILTHKANELITKETQGMEAIQKDINNLKNNPNLKVGE